MIRARCLARSLELEMRTEILAAARALKLIFADASALWLSKQGAALASNAQPNSAAVRFAQAYATKNNWAVLDAHQSWPFPRPDREGDWVTAPVPNIPALRAQVVKRASIRLLPSMAVAGTDSIAAVWKFLQISAPETISSLPSVDPTQKRRFLLITRYCLKRDPEGLDEQINFIERQKNKGDCDGVLGLDLLKDTLRSYSFDTFLQRLHKYRNTMAVPEPDLDEPGFSGP